jgi:hypothetical protein
MTVKTVDHIEPIKPISQALLIRATTLKILSRTFEFETFES